MLPTSASRQERRRKQLEKETPEECLQRKEREKEVKERYRAKLSKEQKERNRQKDRDRYAAKKALETPAEKEDRLQQRYDNNLKQKTYSLQTKSPVERERLLQYHRDRYRRMKAGETESEKIERRTKNNISQMLRRALEDVEEREARLQADRERHAATYRACLNTGIPKRNKNRPRKRTKKSKAIKLALQRKKEREEKNGRLSDLLGEQCTSSDQCSPPSTLQIKVEQVEPMAEKDDSDILKKIQENYVPFLKKFIRYMESSKKDSSGRLLPKLKAIYTVFTTAPPSEQIETFSVNEKKLDNWFNKAGLTKEKVATEKEPDVTTTRRSKRNASSVNSDESSQGACDSTQPSSKKACTSFSNSLDSDSSSQPSILMVKSVSQPELPSQNSTNLPVDIINIKKEKVEKARAVATRGRKSASVSMRPPDPDDPPVPPVQAVSPPVSSPPREYNDACTFTCASCQYQTEDEAEFMKHARTDHRTDLSMWCKHCGKCFSNAGVLIAHIREKCCFKEEMLYKCGVKDCVFETNSGQTFVHHLRHCHKGSPFIFCVHCQKIFTLPHCLILHMQDDCPFKMRNRKYPGPEPAAPPAAPAPVARPGPPRPQVPSVVTNTVRQQTPKATYGVIQAPRSGSILTTPARASAPMVGISRGRGSRGGGGRGRGRGRGRVVMTDSSDSDDPDDPIWRPEEITDANVRRSARFAKKINDCRNPEPSTSGVGSPSVKKSFVDADINSKMINCPCCEFMTAIQSVLEDHYIASHKVPNKNACLVCHLKFEATKSFLDHFEEHRSGSLPNGPPPEASNEPKTLQISQLATPARTETPKTAVPAPVTTPGPTYSEGSEKGLPKDPEPFDDVLLSLADSKLVDPAACRSKAIKIPYQAVIHDRNNKDVRLRKFEELKSPSDLIAMKTIQKLQHFFKCALYACTFTSDSISEFADHLKSKHQGKRFHCCYCFKEELNGDMLAKHIVFKHNTRVYQCSKCFYRACSKAHLQIHIKNGHSQELYTELLECDAVVPPNNDTYEEESTAEENITWPYICAIGSCDFSTYSPGEFKKHNEKTHRTVSIYYCFYCKVDFLTLQRLTNHLRLHGLNKFQCSYCIHGAGTKEEILNHLCNGHADQPLKAFMRASQEEASEEAKELGNVICEPPNATDYTQLYSVKHNIAVQNNAKGYQTEKTYTGYEDKLYHVIENACYPPHMQNSCFPRLVRSSTSDIICGIPFCNEKLESIHLYMLHLRKVHDALNFPCPHCPEMNQCFEDFQNHLICHTSKLYSCGVEECGYYDWNKDKVRDHKKQHLEHNSDSGPIAIREFATLDNEYKLHALSLDVEFPDYKDYLMCLFCKYKCSDPNVMKNHLYRELAYLRFDCCLCEMKCLSRKGIKDHFISCHPDTDISCSSDYNIEIEAMVKYMLQHENKFKNVKLSESCDMCCKKFKNPLRLQSHLYLCLQKEYRPYECAHCKRHFPSVLVLKYHNDEDHESKALEFTFQSNYAIQDDIEKNLLKVRLRQLKDVFEEREFAIDADAKSFKVKFYTCSDCSYEGHHKYNVQRHNNLKHEGAAKVMKGIENSIDSNNSSAMLDDDNSNDDADFAKRYSCGYCIKKMLTTHEVDMHMRKAHTVNKEYFYYFVPDVNKQYLADDKEIYECAYCKSTRENLFSLKKHADLMHSEMEFRVKGFVFSSLSQNSLACGYCYLKVSSPSELHAHSTLSHPLLALKSFGDFQTNMGKHGLDTSDDIPNKRVKFGSTVYVCSHCGGAFATQELVTEHSKKAHSRINLEYTTKEQSEGNKDSTDFRFYKCEFCKFTSEKQYLDKHLAMKHKMRVKCSYCTKRFEYASKLKEHHDEAHKGLPLKYSQETVTSGDSNSGDKNDKVTDDENASHYKKKPDPIDLSSITVRMETKEGKSANLPLVYVTERFNMFPKVIVTDIMKNNKN